jgi:hypothetical protein
MPLNLKQCEAAARRIDSDRPIRQPWIISDANAKPPKHPDAALIDISREVSREEAELIVQSLARSLNRYGFVFLPNDGRLAELMTALHAAFIRVPAKRGIPPSFIVYRPHGAGTMGDSVPEGYEVYHASREYIERECKESDRFTLVGTPGIWGSRWHYGPMWFEKYWGDREPKLDPGGPLRLVIWQAVSRMDTPKGWHRTSLTNHFKMTGFATVVPDYEQNWSSHALRHRAKWLKERDQWELFTPTLQEFMDAYKRCKMDSVLKYLYLDLLKHKGQRLELYALRRKAPGSSIEAGFAAVDIPEFKQSKHFASFILPSAKQDPVGIGLMDEWHRDALKKGFQYLDFGLYWAPGDPKDWRGFSRFKGQFGIWYVRYPLPMVRLIGKISELFR